MRQQHRKSECCCIQKKTFVADYLLAPVCTLFSLLLLVSQAEACGFFVSNFDATKLDGGAVLEKANYYNKFRGPDATNINHVHGWTFLHNLLSMTGNATLQPFVSDNGMVATVFNGEIYNYNELAKELKGAANAEYPSDGFSIIPAYTRWGDQFVEHLHGEFALVVVDFAREIVILSTDAFSTKPLWYGTWPCDKNGMYDDNGSSATTTTTCFATASYESSLTGMGVPKEHRKMADANEALVLSLNQFNVISRSPAFRFDLNQHKTSTDDWQNAFIEAVRVRSDRIKHKMFIGLSAGFDTGAIMLALELLGRPFYAYYIGNKVDDESIIRQRVGYCQHSEASFIYLNKDTYSQQKKWLQNRAEKFRPRRSDRKNRKSSVTDGTGAVTRSFILSDVRKRGGLIYLTGAGADETISDYAMDGKPFPNLGISCFGGRFPANLTEIFPWCSFYYETQRDYIMSCELTGGAHGIESRYPFLDPHVVQEYLWLKADVKNAEYKKPIADFLRKYDFPNMYDVKAGFKSTQYAKGETEIVTLSITSNLTTDVDLKKGIAARTRAFHRQSTLPRSMTRPKMTSFNLQASIFFALWILLLWRLSRGDGSCRLLLLTFFQKRKDKREL